MNTKLITVICTALGIVLCSCTVQGKYSVTSGPNAVWVLQVGSDADSARDVEVDKDTYDACSVGEKYPECGESDGE